MNEPTQTAQDRQVRVTRRYHHFAMVPVLLLKSTDISAQAVRAFGLLDSYCSWDTNRAYPSHGRIAADMGVSIPTLRRAIKELVDSGYVSIEATVDERGLRTGTIYTLNDPEDVFREQSAKPHGNALITDDQGTRLWPFCALWRGVQDRLAGCTGTWTRIVQGLPSRSKCRRCSDGISTLFSTWRGPARQRRPGRRARSA